MDVDRGLLHEWYNAGKGARAGPPRRAPALPVVQATHPHVSAQAGFAAVAVIVALLPAVEIADHAIAIERKSVVGPVTGPITVVVVVVAVRRTISINVGCAYCPMK